MIGEQSIPIDEVQITLLRMREPLGQGLSVFSGIEAKKIIQPFFDWIVAPISNWLFQLNFFELPSWERLTLVGGVIMLRMHSILSL
jgi:hypothetical protein